MPCPFLIFSQSDYLIQIVDTNSYTKWQTVQIQISWLLQKPTDLDLHCLQRQGISGFSRTRVKMHVFTCRECLYIQQPYKRSWFILLHYKGICFAFHDTSLLLEFKQTYVSRNFIKFQHKGMFAPVYHKFRQEHQECIRQ